MDNHRITAVEEKLAFLESTVDSLDGVLRDAFDRLSETQARVRRLEARLTELADANQGSQHTADPGDPTDADDDELRQDMPPHW